jgi:alkaline phosphatase D
LQDRQFASTLVLGAVLALALPGAASAAKFTDGVTAGEVSAKSAVVWGHATKQGKVKAEVARDKRFHNIEDKDKVKAKESRDFTVQTRMKGLKPGKKHYYRFCKGNKCSERGTFKTAPKSKKSKTIRFAYTGDTDGSREPGAPQPFFGTFRTFAAMLAEDNHFNVHFGDTIYSDSGVAGNPTALTRAEKWAKYKQNLEQANLTNLRKSAGFYSHWDDHEFINDFSIPEDGKQIYTAGQRAFRDYAPVKFSDDEGLYRSYRWGKNLELFFLDQRSFRSAKASASCINPDTGDPDLAPTATPSQRALFSALIPSLSQPVSQACKNAINDPNRTLLGNQQFNEFVKSVDESTARWKIVMNETPIQQFYGLPYDRWEGYAFERVKLLNELESRGVNHLTFLTTDTHAAFENVVRTRTYAADVAPSNAAAQPHDTPYHDHIIGPVATNPFWPEIDATTGQPGSGELLSKLFFSPPPPNGVGMSCDQGDQNSYGEVTVSKSSVTIEYKTEDGGPVRNTSGDVCGPYVITD